MTILVLATLIFTGLSHANLVIQSADLSKTVQEQIQRHFDHIFGSKKSEVFIFVELDYPENMKQRLSQNLETLLNKEAQYLAELNKTKPKDTASKDPVFSSSANITWVFPGGNPTEAERRAYILPGFQLPNQPGGIANANPAQTGLQSPSTALPFGDAQFMQSLAVKIKRIFVKVLLDKSLPRNSEEKVQVVIGMMFNLDRERGDRMVIDRVTMYNPISELLRDTSFLGALVTGIAIIVVGSLALIAIFFALMILRNYLRERAAYSPEVVRSVEGMRHGALQGASEQAMLALPEEASPSHHLASRGASAEVANDLIKIVPDQLHGLYQLLGNEEPARIALVIAKLEPRYRMEFLNFFGGVTLAQILEALSQPKFVDPEVIVQLKKRIEHYLSGFFGGEEEVLRILENSSIENRNALLKAIQEKTPNFYKQVRPKILVFEDLERFDDTSFIKILSRVPLEKISWLVNDGLGDGLREKIMKCLPKKTQDTVVQFSSMMGQIPKQRLRQAREELLALAGRMVKEGMISPPAIASDSSISEETALTPGVGGAGESLSVDAPEEISEEQKNG